MVDRCIIHNQHRKGPPSWMVAGQAWDGFLFQKFPHLLCLAPNKHHESPQMTLQELLSSGYHGLKVCDLSVQYLWGSSHICTYCLTCHTHSHQSISRYMDGMWISRPWNELFAHHSVVTPHVAWPAWYSPSTFQGLLVFQNFEHWHRPQIW